MRYISVFAVLLTLAACNSSSPSGGGGGGTTFSQLTYNFAGGAYPGTSNLTISVNSQKVMTALLEYPYGDSEGNPVDPCTASATLSDSDYNEIVTECNDISLISYEPTIDQNCEMSSGGSSWQFTYATTDGQTNEFWAQCDSLGTTDGLKDLIVGTAAANITSCPIN